MNVSCRRADTRIELADVFATADVLIGLLSLPLPLALPVTGLREGARRRRSGLRRIRVVGLGCVLVWAMRHASIVAHPAPRTLG